MTIYPTVAGNLRNQNPAPTHMTVQRWLLISLSLWFVLVLVLAGSGMLALLPTPFLPLPIALSLSGLLIIYGRVAAFRAYIHALDLRTLTLYNVWRIPAALAFFYYGGNGELPAIFVRNAGWGDLIAGILALIVVYGVGRVTKGRIASFTAYHLFSITDFVVAVGTGFAFSLLNDPLMEPLKHLPMAIIPLFGVPITGAFSLMTLHRLYVKRG